MPRLARTSSSEDDEDAGLGRSGVLLYRSVLVSGVGCVQGKMDMIAGVGEGVRKRKQRKTRKETKTGFSNSIISIGWVN